MKNVPLITWRVFEPAPRPETGASDIGWPPTPDLVEASDQIIWSENNNIPINVTANPPPVWINANHIQGRQSSPRECESR